MKSLRWGVKRDHYASLTWVWSRVVHSAGTPGRWPCLGRTGIRLVYGFLLDIFFDVRNKVHIKLFMYKVQRNYKCDILCYEWLGFFMYIVL